MGRRSYGQVEKNKVKQTAKRKSNAKWARRRSELKEERMLDWRAETLDRRVRELIFKIYGDYPGMF
jgi:hypothetical protein